MRTQQVLATIKWLDSEFQPVKHFLGQTVSGATRDPEKLGRTLVGPFLLQLGRFTERVEQSPDAPKVLKAFELDHILDPDQVTKRFNLEGDTADNEQGAYVRLRHLLNAWESMVETVKPLTKLTSIELHLNQNEDTLQINVADRSTLTLKSIIEILSDIQSLYDTAARLTGDTEYEPLQIIKIESGTSLSLSVRGLGEPIKEIKNFVLEMWTKHRHKRADEIIDHNRAVASSLQLIGEIDKKVKELAITNEDGNRFRRAVIERTLQ